MHPYGINAGRAVCYEYDLPSICRKHSMDDCISNELHDKQVAIGSAYTSSDRDEVTTLQDLESCPQSSVDYF